MSSSRPPATAPHPTIHQSTWSAHDQASVDNIRSESPGRSRSIIALHLLVVMASAVWLYILFRIWPEAAWISLLALITIGGVFSLIVAEHGGRMGVVKR